MAVFSTFRNDRAPELEDPEIQYLAPAAKNRHSFFAWQLATTPVWGLAGLWLRDATIPEWLMQEKYFPLGWIGVMAFIMIPCLKGFCQRFADHYIEICTVDLPKGDREIERMEFERKSIVCCSLCSVFFLPALIGFLFCLANPRAVYDCFLQWFTYGRHGVDAPGVLRSPAGIQFLRVWNYRLVVFLFGFATPDVLGLTVLIVMAGSIGFLLRPLWRMRRANLQ